MITKEIVGNFDGRDVIQYNLINNNDMQVSIINYGGIIRKILFKDKDGINDNRILSYKDINLYKKNPMFFGAIIGRIAGRISNAKYILDNIWYELEKNEDDRNLHGGTNGVHHKFWEANIKEEFEKSTLRLSLEDMQHDGFIGDLSICVEYSLDNNNSLEIKYFVKTNRRTICNMTNHMYFNLSGSMVNDTIENHYLSIDANKIAMVDEKTLPIGKFLEADQDEIFNFNKMRKVGLYGMNTHEQQKIVNDGYDHAFKLNKNCKYDISLKEEKSGIRVDVNTTEDAVVVYSCNKVDIPYELEKHTLKKYSGITIETQQMPDIVNTTEFDKVVIEPNKPYQSKTIFHFSIEKG